MEAKTVTPLSHFSDGKIALALSAMVMNVLQRETVNHSPKVESPPADIETYRGGFAPENAFNFEFEAWGYDRIGCNPFVNPQGNGDAQKPSLTPSESR